ncbi:U3 small nucleolar RNA-associated protein 15 [Tilletia horrida]|uniref:U3 small nucleolar RNA-associated protein 15 n=1 Tax=Tilletia horrida TaxID=155126 RepID=A0AAN6GS81_9BASI|nr:U3 small nucleolar RNA-associated protein 15 [Tilletia horrida]KAK0563966.1 U3 small nucleolar RNA-associated protein 15 [Tilletia horrida]
MDYRKIATPAPSQPIVAAPGTSESAHWRRYRAPVFCKEFAPITSIHFVPPLSDFTEQQELARQAAEQSDTVDPLALSTSASRSAADAASRNRFAVTAGSRVQIYDSNTARVTKSINRFKDVARSANIRQDAKLMVAGDDSGLIQIFDLSSRAILRTMRGHRLATHVTHFSSDPTQVLSASDDKTVRLWDIPTQEPITVLDRHTDYVRSAIVSPDNPSLLLSGSYDGTVRLWDVRMEGHKEAMRMKHGAPVEDVLILPTGGGGLALSCGGPVLRVWDLMMGGRCARAVSNHQKTITSMSFSLASPSHDQALDEEGAGSQSRLRLLTAGLDQLVKVYDPALDYRVTHTMRYPSPILSLALSPDESTLATGMADGTLCVRRRHIKKGEAERRRTEQKARREGALDFFLNSTASALTSAEPTEAKGQDGLSIQKEQNEIDDAPLPLSLEPNSNHDPSVLVTTAPDGSISTTVRATADSQSHRKGNRNLKEYDKYFRAFRYHDALDAALRKGVPAHITFGVIRELIHRSPAVGASRVGSGFGDDTAAPGLASAIAGRDEITLEPLLRFLLRYATSSEYADLVNDTLGLVIDIYAPVLGQSPLIDDLFGRIWAKVAQEVRLQRDLVGVQGSIEMLISHSSLN